MSDEPQRDSQGRWLKGARAPSQSRVAASQALLDRGFGKPVQSLDVESKSVSYAVYLPHVLTEDEWLARYGHDSKAIDGKLPGAVTEEEFIEGKAAALALPAPAPRPTITPDGIPLKPEPDLRDQVPIDLTPDRPPPGERYAAWVGFLDGRRVQRNDDR